MAQASIGTIHSDNFCDFSCLASADLQNKPVPCDSVKQIIYFNSHPLHNQWIGEIHKSFESQYLIPFSLT